MKYILVFFIALFSLTNANAQSESRSDRNVRLQLFSKDKQHAKEHEVCYFRYKNAFLDANPEDEAITKEVLLDNIKVWLQIKEELIAYADDKEEARKKVKELNLYYEEILKKEDHKESLMLLAKFQKMIK